MVHYLRSIALRVDSDRPQNGTREFYLLTAKPFLLFLYHLPRRGIQSATRVGKLILILVDGPVTSANRLFPSAQRGLFGFDGQFDFDGWWRADTPARSAVVVEWIRDTLLEAGALLGLDLEAVRRAAENCYKDSLEFTKPLAGSVRMKTGGHEYVGTPMYQILDSGAARVYLDVRSRDGRHLGSVDAAEGLVKVALELYVCSWRRIWPKWDGNALVVLTGKFEAQRFTFDLTGILGTPTAGEHGEPG